MVVTILAHNAKPGCTGSRGTARPTLRRSEEAWYRQTLVSGVVMVLIVVGDPPGPQSQRINGAWRSRGHQLHFRSPDSSGRPWRLRRDSPQEIFPRW